MMRGEIRDQVLQILGDMKREAKNPQNQSIMDRMAVDLISGECKPQVMVSGLQTWMGLHAL